MAKKVFFQPEDFDKPQKKSSKKKLAWAVGICAALALVGIGGYALLAPKTLESAEKNTVAIPSGIDKPESESYGEVASVEVSDEANTNISEMDVTDQKSEGGLVKSAEDQSPISVAGPSSTETPTATPIEGESLDREAIKVIRGDYGDGKTRMNRLGVNYKRIQSRVNELKRSGIF